MAATKLDYNNNSSKGMLTKQRKEIQVKYAMKIYKVSRCTIIIYYFCLKLELLLAME